jgi:hypothetical protein
LCGSSSARRWLVANGAHNRWPAVRISAGRWISSAISWPTAPVFAFVVDQFTRECIWLEPHRSMTGAKVVAALTKASAERNWMPMSITCENGLNAGEKFRMSAGEVRSTQANANCRRDWRQESRVPEMVFHEFRDPAHHNEHKICAGAQSRQRPKQCRGPVEGPTTIYEVKWSSRLNGPCERDRSTGKSVFKEAFVIRAVFDYGINHSGHLGSNSGEAFPLRSRYRMDFPTSISHTCPGMRFHAYVWLAARPSRKPSAVAYCRV